MSINLAERLNELFRKQDGDDRYIVDQGRVVISYYNPETKVRFQFGVGQAPKAAAEILRQANVPGNLISRGNILGLPNDEIHPLSITFSPANPDYDPATLEDIHDPIQSEYLDDLIITLYNPSNPVTLEIKRQVSEHELNMAFSSASIFEIGRETLSKTGFYIADFIDAINGLENWSELDFKYLMGLHIRPRIASKDEPFDPS